MANFGPLKVRRHEAAAPGAETLHASDGRGNILCCAPGAFRIAPELRTVTCPLCRRIARRAPGGKHELRVDCRPRGLGRSPRPKGT